MEVLFGIRPTTPNEIHFSASYFIKTMEKMVEFDRETN